MNVIHSIDGYLLRSVIRRASFNEAEVNNALSAITAVLLERANGKATEAICPSADLQNMLNIYQYSKMLDTSIINHMDAENVNSVPTELLLKLSMTLTKMLELGTSPVLTVHDA